MTRFDIRVRRKQFTQSRIEQHKNYKSLLDRHYEQGRKKTRGWLVLVFLVILIIALLLAFFNRPEVPEQVPPPPDPHSEITVPSDFKVVD